MHCIVNDLPKEHEKESVDQACLGCSIPSLQINTFKATRKNDLTCFLIFFYKWGFWCSINDLPSAYGTYHLLQLGQGEPRGLHLSQALKVIPVSAKLLKGCLLRCAETGSFFCGLHSPKHKTPKPSFPGRPYRKDLQGIQNFL